MDPVTAEQFALRSDSHSMWLDCRACTSTIAKLYRCIDLHRLHVLVDEHRDRGCLT